MAKIQFTFDAIGRELLPAEKTAARVFVSKYEAPPNSAAAQKTMQTVKVRVQKAVVSGRPFTTAFYDQVKQASGSKAQGSEILRSSLKVTKKAHLKRPAKA